MSPTFIWENVYTIANNRDEKSTIKLAVNKVIAMRISMNKFSSKGKIYDDYVYGITSILLYANTKGLTLELCKDFESTKANEFIIDEYYFSDLKNSTSLTNETSSLKLEG